MLETFNENFASDLKEKAQLSATPLCRKNVRATQQEAEKDFTDEDLANSVIDASNTFGKVEFLSYYSKLKSTWNNQDVRIMKRRKTWNEIAKSLMNQLLKWKEIVHQLDSLPLKLLLFQCNIMTNLKFLICLLLRTSLVTLILSQR
ncbi:5237_t:CDS:2 [Acaulospora colombiana]|uniref:5237_t:CDS:1 n=1 Tax=Acaulospora colombiana TaxID=27376 RepID=A0ACA9ME71_9GLOM|nr:5237_t:CDS:2 [Acaulospora colombiana]